ncbi:MAG: hypothetical protein GY801_50085 [bacterium]|nr:hypothetical protein [bacterium]
MKARPDRPFENPAIAKTKTTMMAMEVELIREMVHSHTLRLDQYEDLNRLQLIEAQVIILTNPRDRFKRH